MLTTIEHGSVGAIVQAAQLLTGYAERDKASGQYDADFVAYVATWQKNHHLTSDGSIGPKTWTAIAGSAPVCSTSKHRTSAATQALQLLLDGAALTPDGVFGPNTKKAVAAYQAAAGLGADGICGQKTWNMLVTGACSADACPVVSFRQPENYKQHDHRWGKKMYSSHGNASQTMANSGCGPTAMANVIATLVDKSVTPWDMAQLALKWGDRTPSNGTDTSFFKHVQAHFKFVRMVGTGSLTTLKACLDAGGYVVCRMGKGYWTTGGHYITAWKYDKDYIYCNDPSSPTSKREERKKQKQSDFLKQRKDFWCFFPERAA